MVNKVSLKKYFRAMWMVVLSSLFHIVACHEECTGINDEPMEILVTNSTCEKEGNFITLHTSHNKASHLRDSNYCLPALPENLCDFRNIQKITLSHNNIRSISNISCLGNLTFLDLSYNKIEELQTGVFDFLVRLVKLDLTYNRIHTIELGVFHPGLSCLKNVLLDHNNLTSADLWIFNMSSRLSRFSVSNNHISHFTNKDRFSASKNEIPTMDNSLRFNLTSNNFSVWNNTFFESLSDDPLFFATELLTKRYNFEFKNNPWLCDCHIYQIMAIFQGTLGFFIQYDTFEIYCQKPPHLAGKKITAVNRTEFVCNITHRCPPSCFCQKQPHLDQMFIDCSGARLQEMPRVLPEYHRIILHFQNNSIQHLPNLSYVKHIAYLNLSCNNLSSISATFFENSEQLKVLDLSNNELQYLPETIQKFSGDDIAISNNPLRCSCENMWFWQWFQSKSNFRSKVNTTCSLPEGPPLYLQNVSADILTCDHQNHKNVIVIATVFSFILVSMVAFGGYFRYEILTIYYLYICPKLRILRKNKKIRVRDVDVFVMLNEDNDDDRLWIRDFMIPYLQARLHTFFIPFTESLPGDVTAETNLEKIRNCSTIVVYVSHAFLENSNCMHELEEAYCCMVKEGNGELLLIRQKDVNISKLRNGHTKALLRVGHVMEADDPVFSKTSSVGRF